jgi:hypothetical protein
LLEAKADTEAKDKDGQTPLFWAVRERHEAMVKQLLEGKANIEAKEEFGRTPLIWAASEGHEAMVKQLLEGKANIEAKEEFGRTPLYWAIKGGHEAVVKATPMLYLFIIRYLTSTPPATFYSLTFLYTPNNYARIFFCFETYFNL